MSVTFESHRMAFKELFIHINKQQTEKEQITNEPSQSDRLCLILGSVFLLCENKIWNVLVATKLKGQFPIK